MKFHTRFDVAETKNKDNVYDVHDNVDRISYVDSTRLVERFILEGHNLNEIRAKALRSGLYSGDMSEIENNDTPIIPVYKTDPALLDPVIESAKIRLASSVAEKQKSASADAPSATSMPNNGASDNSEK